MATISPAPAPDLDAAGARAAAVRPLPLPLAPTAPARPAPGLTVLLGTQATLPLAGYLLRHGPALTLIETAPDAVAVGASMGGFALPLYDVDDLDARRQEQAERALAATAAAGFDPHAVETLPPGDVVDRLRGLAGDEVACVVTATRSARRARRLARAARAPVLVLPPRDGAPAGGPAVVPEADAAVLAPVAARALATEHAVLVAPYDRVEPDVLVRTAAHPILAPQLTGLAMDAEWAAIDAAWERARAAALVAEEHGLAAEPAVSAEPGAVLAAVAEREGVVVVADRGGFRAPALLRAALRAGRAVLLVPTAT